MSTNDEILKRMEEYLKREREYDERERARWAELRQKMREVMGQRDIIAPPPGEMIH
jgi:hypothetical protein